MSVANLSTVKQFAWQEALKTAWKPKATDATLSLPLGLFREQTNAQPLWPGLPLRQIFSGLVFDNQLETMTIHFFGVGGTLIALEIVAGIVDAETDLAQSEECSVKRVKSHVEVRKKPAVVDNGGRRLGVDRRWFRYNGYLPERRTGNERRTILDRRKTPRSAKSA